MRYKKVNKYIIDIGLILILFFVFSNFAIAKNLPSNPNFTKINEFECSWKKHSNYDHNDEEIKSYDQVGIDDFSVFNLNSDSGVASVSPPYFKPLYYYKTDLFFKFFSFYSSVKQERETGSSSDIVIFNKSDGKNNYKAVYVNNFFHNDLKGLSAKYGSGANITTFTKYGTCKAIKRP